MRRCGILPIWALTFALLLYSRAVATPEYAERTGFGCQRCHTEETGGRLTETGKDFRDQLGAKGLYRPLNPLQRIFRLVIGYIHLIAAIAWFGTILYVHILLKPAYAAKGLPRGELVLGWAGIILLSLTGVLLTVSRISSWSAFFTTKFGILLFTKIVLFAIMVCTALVVTLVIGPRLRRQSTGIPLRDANRIASSELAYFDGKDGRPAYFAYKGYVYDVSTSNLWKDGSHMKRHFAGSDLTGMLKTAPHGEDKILGLVPIAELVPSAGWKKRNRAESIFYLMAYMNLISVFLITFIIALWRWG